MDQAANASAVPGYHRKIISIDRLESIIRSARAARGRRSSQRVFVQCHGCFDIVHPGHIRYLQFARAQGDCLIVSITGDAAIEKGDLRPYIPQELRAENLAALEIVDFVVIDPSPTASHILSVLRPDVYVKGQEYATSCDARFVEEKRVVESYGGRVLFSSGQVVFSSTLLGANLRGMDDLADQRRAAVCRRHQIDRPRIASITASFRGKRVLVFGDAIIERYVLCDSGGVASDAAMMSLTELDRKEYFGGAALLAAQIAALGARPTLVTALGQDVVSTRLADRMEKQGITLLCAARRPETPQRTRFLVDEQKVLKVDRAHAIPLDSLGERRALDILFAEVRHADLAILYDAGYGVITPGLASQLGRRIRRTAGTVAAALAGPHDSLAILKDLDLICTSERRLRADLHDLTGGLSSLAYRVLDLMQATQTIVSLGKRGAVTFDRPSHDRGAPEWTARLLSEYLPAFPTQVVDRLGCAECLLAVASLAIASGASLMQAAYVGQAACALQIARMGPVPIQIGEIGGWLAGRPELSDPVFAPRSAPILTPIPERAHEPVRR